MCSLINHFYSIGQDPLDLNFDAAQFRNHLLMCLEKGDIQPFPNKKVHRKQKSIGTSGVLVFCKCRTQESGKMLECSSCSEWFHKECLEVRGTRECDHHPKKFDLFSYKGNPVPEKAWTEPRFKWYCEDCVENDSQSMALYNESEVIMCSYDSHSC